MGLEDKKAEFLENPYKYIKTWLMDIVVVVVALAYVFYQMINLEKTNVNPLILLAQAVMGIICGVVIKQALGENGFSKGYNSKAWNDEKEKYDEACGNAVDYVDRVDNFYLYLEKEKKENYRRSHLQAAHLRYDQWFDSMGDYKGEEAEFKKLKLHQKIAVRKCIRVRIHVLNLFSEYATSSEQDTKREMTDRRQRSKTMAKNTISATLIAVIGVYFVPMLNGWSWASFISATMQVSLWIIFGVLQLYTNYNFIVEDKVSILREKKKLIARLIKGSEEGQYLRSPYDTSHLMIEQKKTL